MKHPIARAFVLLLALAGGFYLIAGQSRPAAQAPNFEVDPFWPKPLPNHWVLGSTIGLSVDANDHVWVIHRPSTVEDNLRPRIFHRRSGFAARSHRPSSSLMRRGISLTPGEVPARDTNGRRVITASPSITRETFGLAAMETPTRRF